MDSHVPSSNNKHLFDSQSRHVRAMVQKNKTPKPQSVSPRTLQIEPTPPDVSFQSKAKEPLDLSLATAHAHTPLSFPLVVFFLPSTRTHGQRKLIPVTFWDFNQILPAIRAQELLNDEHEAHQDHASKGEFWHPAFYLTPHRNTKHSHI